MKTETGAPDRCEFYNVSQDDLLGQSSAPRTNPDPIAAHTQLLRSYLEHGQFALTHILRALATQLELLPDTFRDLQAPNRASGTIMRLIRYAPSLTSADMRTGLLPHTDFGSVTLLANVLGGLQVLLPDSAPEDENSWQWVRPQPDCLIVNMGDAMVEWTGGVLRSNMHRVNYAPGDQRYIDRYAIAMLVRPYKEAPMSRLKGGRIPTLEDDQCEGIEIVNDNANNVGNLTAYEWELTKAMSLKEGSDCARSRGGRQLKPKQVAVLC
jgi:isopenicillin N synthase-like dioxygenase